MNASREAERYRALIHLTTHTMYCLYTCRKNLTTLTLQSDAAMKALQEKKEKVAIAVEHLSER